MSIIYSHKVVTKSYFIDKKVIVRVDFNVPTENGVVMDITRIKNAYPTIKFLQESGAKIILMSHLGKTSSYNPNQSLRILIDHISKEYNSNVVFIDNYLDHEAEEIVASTHKNDIILLENLRFHTEEEACDPVFAKKLAHLADFYINEAFSTSHRKHASICEISKFLPSALGLSFANEIKTIDSFLHGAKKPKMCLIGGSKIETKAKLLKNLVCKVDKLAVGGKIAGVFLNFTDNLAFKMFADDEHNNNVEEIFKNAKEHACELILPVDFSALINNEEISKQANTFTSQENMEMFDIGPKTVELFKRHIRESSTVLWNGPLGLFEMTPFDFGTKTIAEEIAILTREGKLTSIVGGGDTAFAMNKFGVSNDLTYQSTSGGAFLTYLEGGELYGIASMKNRYVIDPKSES